MNEFRTVLAKTVESGRLRIANQYGGPYYDDSPFSIFSDKEYLNFSEESFDWTIGPMKTTKRRLNVLAALKECGLLKCSNFYKRIIEVEIAAGHSKKVNVYSIAKTILTSQAQAKVTALEYDEFLFGGRWFPNGFIPLLTVVDERVAGRLISDETDEAETVFVSGQTRSGKTFFLVQQAVIHAASGVSVIVFDQTGAFTSRELRKHLPEAIVDKYFSLWDLGEQGLPVNLLSLERCKGLRDKKDRLENVLSVLARLTGEVQSKTLRSRLAKISREIEAGQLHGLSGVLRFFDADDPDQAVIRDRLAEAFEDLEDLPESWMTWGEFLAAQGKIVIISTGSDSIRKSSQFIDALLASLYAWKQYNYDERMTVILDEISDLCLEKKGPIDTVMRKGGKNRLALMLATQQYSAEKDLLGEVIGNCGMKVFFRPKDSDLKDVSKKTGIERQQLATLMQGECVATGSFHSKTSGKNITATLKGKTYSAVEYLAPPDQPTETPAVSDALFEAQSDEEFMLSESAILCDLPLTSPVPDEIETEPEMQPSQLPEMGDDVADAGLSEAKEPTSVEPSTMEPTEVELPEAISATEEQPMPPKSEPVELEEDSKKMIELDLQQQFQYLKQCFSPDYPGWRDNLAKLFKQIKEQHQVADLSDRDKLSQRLDSFLYVSPECYDYRRKLDTLFHELWPST